MEKAINVKNLMSAIRFLQKKTILLLPLTLLVIMLSGFFELATAAKRPAEVSKTMLLEADSWEHSQGIATDGDYYFFSCKYGLVKTELDCKTVVKRNAAAIPAELANEYGAAHIGGISCSGGKVYCSVEDSKVWKHPLVVVYDAVTLEYTGEFYQLDPAKHTKGLPWVSVDPETGVFLCSSRDNSTEIMRYDPKTEAYLDPVVLVNDDKDFNIHKIQGGDVLDGVLYVATNNDTQAVYSIDLQTGAAKKLFDRNLFPGSEGEGLTVLKTKDGAVLHAMDMSPIFVSAYVRHFSLK